MSPLSSNPVTEWLHEAVTSEASDLHLVPGHRPSIRRHGALKAIGDELLVAAHLEEWLLELCVPQDRDTFLQTQNVDYALRLDIGGVEQRFRANYFRSGQQTGACFRVIPSEIPGLDWSGFPWELADRIVDFRNGLVLITGVTGAGKTTTLAMLTEILNQRGGLRIVTIEEPIEYTYPSYPNSIVTQREVGHDVASFAEGLKYGLRQDPDVILVGEIRDQETARLALSAAETGHLVLSTLHTRDAKGAISRMVDLFADQAQSDIRSQLSLSLRAVVSQHLIPGVDAESKRELAMEVLINNSPIASGIRTGKLETLDNCIQTGAADGMKSLDDSIKELLRQRKITHRTAERYISTPEALNW